MRKTWLKPARKLHKWFGYVLVIQIFAWLLGGLIMSAIPLEKVHGKHLALRQLDSPFTREDYHADLNLLTQDILDIKQLSFKHLLTIPVIKVTAKQTHWFNGVTGQPLATPTESTINQQAQLHYLGTGQIQSTHYFQIGPREIRYKPKVWQVKFDDWQNTTIYLHAHSAEVLSVRSHIWRIFDFFWMLHIMDYDERSDFNNPLLISFSAFSVLFCMTGMALLLQSPPWRRRKTASQN